MVAPEVSVLWRFVIAAPFMLAIAAMRGEQLRFPLRDHLWLALLGVTLFCTNFVLFYYAAQWITSGLLSVVFCARFDHQYRRLARCCSARRSTGGR